jgi:Phage portal protein, SPP1 Gp6-like
LSALPEPDTLAVAAPERPPFDPDDPAWWLAVLSERLNVRAARYRRRIDYYRGRHELMFLTEKYRQAFGHWLRKVSDNWCSVVVDAVVERMAVNGFRFGDTLEADRDAWNIWQANSLDVYSDDLHTLVLCCGEAATIVEPPETDGGWPRVTVENPLEVTVYGTPRQRVAALKRWRGLDGRVFAVVYLPDASYHFASDRPVEPGMMAQVRFEPDGEESNPLGVVPVVPFRNVGAAVADMRVEPAPSDLDPIMPMQDSINKLVADLMIDAEFSAFRQKVFIGVEAATDEKGRPLNTVESAANRIITLTNENAKTAEFSAADPTGLIRAIEMRNQQVCAIARIPPYYLLGQSGTFPSGESLKAAETGIVRKTIRKQRVLGESHEETQRLAFAWLGDDRADAYDAETIWANPETRSDAVVADAMTKKADVGIPLQQLEEDADYTPVEISRMDRMREQQEEQESGGPGAAEPAGPTDRAAEPGPAG